MLQLAGSMFQQSKKKNIDLKTTFPRQQNVKPQPAAAAANKGKSRCWVHHLHCGGMCISPPKNAAPRDGDSSMNRVPTFPPTCCPKSPDTVRPILYPAAGLRDVCVCVSVLSTSNMEVESGEREPTKTQVRTTASTEAVCSDRFVLPDLDQHR